MPETIAYVNGDQVAPDYGDLLLPGYRFLPTDLELIVYYLIPKLESRKLPECRIHEVNIYNHKPEELTERYRGSEDNWYFFTPRDRRYPKGDRPSRSVSDGGFWKSTTKYKKVYDDAEQKVVGFKRALKFHDENGLKTNWLMKEYTTTEPNLPFENQQNGNKLNDWVLCKIYKNEKKEKSKKVIKEPKKPLPKKRKVQEENSETGFTNDREKIQETNRYDLGTNVQMVENDEIQRSPCNPCNPNSRSHIFETSTNPNYPIPMQPMTTFQDFNLIQQAPCNQNQINSLFRSSDGASSFDYRSVKAVFTSDAMNHNVLQQHVQNSYQDPTIDQLNVPSGSNHDMVVPDHNAADHIPQPDGGDKGAISPFDTNMSIPNYMDGICLDDLDTTIEPNLPFENQENANKSSASMEPLMRATFNDSNHIQTTRKCYWNPSSLIEPPLNAVVQPLDYGGCNPAIGPTPVNSESLLQQNYKANQSVVVTQDANKISQSDIHDVRTWPCDPNKWSFDKFDDEADRFLDDYGAMLPAIDEID